jgi:hypothetical protein
MSPTWIARSHQALHPAGEGYLRVRAPPRVPEQEHADRVPRARARGRSRLEPPRTEAVAPRLHRVLHRPAGREIAEPGCPDPALPLGRGRGAPRRGFLASGPEPGGVAGRARFPHPEDRGRRRVHVLDVRGAEKRSGRRRNGLRVPGRRIAGGDRESGHQDGAPRRAAYAGLAAIGDAIAARCARTAGNGRAGQRDRGAHPARPGIGQAARSGLRVARTRPPLSRRPGADSERTDGIDHDRAKR